MNHSCSQILTSIRAWWWSVRALVCSWIRRSYSPTKKSPTLMVGVWLCHGSPTWVRLVFEIVRSGMLSIAHLSLQPWISFKLSRCSCWVSLKFYQVGRFTWVVSSPTPYSRTWKHNNSSYSIRLLGLPWFVLEVSLHPLWRPVHSGGRE